jgi:EpsI family protein
MKAKSLTALIILLATLGISYVLPEVKYKSQISMSSLFSIPENIGKWRGVDVSDSLNINLEEARFGFISDALAYNFINDRGDNLIFIVLDAGNFHHPKNCFISSGYEIKELPDSEFQLRDQKLRTHTLFIKKGNKSFLSFYWIVINKKLTHKWIDQKLNQLYFSLFGKKRVGLMVRIDIPVQESDIKKAEVLARQFVYDLKLSMDTGESDFLFGE